MSTYYQDIKETLDKSRSLTDYFRSIELHRSIGVFYQSINISIKLFFFVFTFNKIHVSSFELIITMSSQ